MKPWYKIRCVTRPSFTCYGTAGVTKTGRKRKSLVYPDMAWVVFDKAALKNPYYYETLPEDAILGYYETFEDASKAIDALRAR